MTARANETPGHGEEAVTSPSTRPGTRMPGHRTKHDQFADITDPVTPEVTEGLDAQLDR
ncbi:hypothetical protein AB0M57_15065 [Streptomyces sp. NPDC051597]|uniref:hypothetical protein n=1 Tax=Streptomyces sp. NPDC051597 TaxID=3155049 RepID=UPI00341B64D2